MKINCVLMAAGQSRRFQGNKLLAELDGRHLIESVMDIIPKEAFARILVVTRYESIAQMAVNRGYMVVYNKEENPALAVTIRLAVKEAGKEADGCLFLVCDQPFLRRESIRRICESFCRTPDRIVALGYGGKRGNPVLFPKSLLGELAKLQDDETGSHVIKRHKDRLTIIEAEEERELADIDTQEEYAWWQHRTGVTDMNKGKDSLALIKAAGGGKIPDLVIKNASFVNVFTNRIEKGDIAISEGIIVGIGAYEGREVIHGEGKILCPGLIDGHVHIESSMLAPACFAETVLPHGITCVVADPHEIANVLGTEGIDYMLEATKQLPVDVFFTLPSCVPPGPLDESGATLSAKELAPYYGNPRVLGLAEMMAYFQTAEGNAGIQEKIEAAKRAGKRVDGHAPFLAGKALNAYCAAGVASDHECTDYAEAMEKLGRGQWIMIREGTAAQNFEALRELCEEPYYLRCMFVTDDRHPDDLLYKGSIDYIVRKAIKAGVSPIRAIRMGSLHTAQYFGMHDRGAIAPGYLADMLVCSDLDTFTIEKVIKNGKVTAENGKTVKAYDMTHSNAHEGESRSCPPSFHLAPVTEEMFAQAGTGNQQRVIRLIPYQIITEEEIIPLLELPGEETGVSGREDILKIAVLERHHNTGHVGNGYIKGYGLTEGAVATSISHDSHNLITVGRTASDMAAAANAVRECGGGIAFALHGQIKGILPLPIAGLMSTASVEEVIEALDKIRRELTQYGIREDIDPFMTLAFAALSVIPAIRINSLGVIDAVQGIQVPAIF